ncbi:MAG: hypothetical protein Ta2A_02730 [Treponemataceae bacterium]|nr:MAG: hypothetical protein Ta2A_02730 [Treponemataceae bacterium]
MLVMRHFLLLTVIFSAIAFSVFHSCARTVSAEGDVDFEHIAEDDIAGLSTQARFALINSFSEDRLQKKRYNELVVFLTNHVELDSSDVYNAYWLLAIAHAYIENGALPVAQYYFSRIVSQYTDVYVRGQSVHFLCFQNLLKISQNPAQRIFYSKQLLDKFPDKINMTEMYFTLAKEYENTGDWMNALDAYRTFLQQNDAVSIQIAGVQEPYQYARQLIDFNSSSKNWTFATLGELESAVKNALSENNASILDRYRAKVNFFTMSWGQEETDAAGAAQTEFSFYDFIDGNVIQYSDTLNESENLSEAYLRTTGWSQYISVWYFYFRKVNFPPEPEIHGRWEWAGIYFGEKL